MGLMKSSKFKMSASLPSHNGTSYFINLFDNPISYNEPYLAVSYVNNYYRRYKRTGTVVTIRFSYQEIG